MAEQNLHQGHRERLRRRYLEFGSAGFYQHELLELLLFYCIPRQNTNNLAHMLINHFGSLEKVLKAPPEELTKVKGLGPSSANFLGMISKLSEYADKCMRVPPLMLDTFEKQQEHLKAVIRENPDDSTIIISVDMQLGHKNTFVFDLDYEVKSAYAENILRTILVTPTNQVIVAINRQKHIPILTKNEFELISKLAKYLHTFGIGLASVSICGQGQFYHTNDTRLFLSASEKKAEKDTPNTTKNKGHSN